MDKIYLTPLIETKIVADAHRYGKDEHELIEGFILGAQALLYNAGAFKPDNPMTKTVIIMLVGYWLENRDAMNYEHRAIHGLPYSLQAVIYSLQYAPNEGDENE